MQESIQIGTCQALAWPANGHPRLLMLLRCTDQLGLLVATPLQLCFGLQVWMADINLLGCADSLESGIGALGVNIATRRTAYANPANQSIADFNR